MTPLKFINYTRLRIILFSRKVLETQFMYTRSRCRVTRQNIVTDQIARTRGGRLHDYARPREGCEICICKLRSNSPFNYVTERSIVLYLDVNWIVLYCTPCRVDLHTRPIFGCYCNLSVRQKCRSKMNESRRELKLGFALITVNISLEVAARLNKTFGICYCILQVPASLTLHMLFKQLNKIYKGLLLEIMEIHTWS